MPGRVSGFRGFFLSKIVEQERKDENPNNYINPFFNGVPVIRCMGTGN